MPAIAAKQFQKAAYYHAGLRPYHVITADFNNDGNADLAFADWLSDQVVILLGNADGTFQKQKVFSLPAAIALASGDFNEDGNLDLAVTQSGGTGDGVVTILLGDGKGNFHKSANYVIGVASTSVAVADFNGDGHMDVVVTDKGFEKAGDVIVFFGTGKGTLKKGTKYKMSGGPFSVAVQDLNGDHHPDLAVAEETGGSVAVLINDGTGKFLKPVTYNAGGGEVADVKIADLRNNGTQDLVVANASQGMVVLLNQGNGVFGKPTIYVPICHNCQAPLACVVADFNLDGNLDVACATNSEDSYFFYGDGKGKFGSAIPINETIKFNGGYSIAVGDFNHDNAPDIAIPIELKGKVAVLLNSQ